MVEHLERWLIPVMLVFGLIYVCLVPPFQAPDESNHFLRAYQISEGRFFPETTGSRLGGDLPQQAGAVCDSFIYLRLKENAHLNAGLFKRMWNQPPLEQQRRFTDFANTAIYIPAAYTPQAAAIAAVRLLGASPLQCLYAARLANLLVWLMLVFASVRLLPLGSRSVLFFALLPASLVIAASASADVLTNGLCWWFLAASLVAPTSSFRFFKQTVVIGLISAYKIITLPLSLLMYTHAYTRRQVTVLTGVGLIFAIGWGLTAANWFIPYDQYDPGYRDTQTLNSGVDPTRQIQYILAHPFNFLSTMVHSMVEAVPSMAAHLTGKFGWEKNYLPGYWIGLLWVSIFGLLFSEKNTLTKGQRGRFIAVSVLYVVGFAVTMYALWCKVGAERIHNWQGRYFIAILPLLGLAIANSCLVRWRNQLEAGAYLIGIAANVAMVFAIWVRYYPGI
ncbi:MAG: DUF2142 domain-containing protein [Saprospiraceae bacterium]|nr:DUF2142 domain-containing protein [Saprospiraceae bacterium]